MHFYIVVSALSPRSAILAWDNRGERSSSVTGLVLYKRSESNLNMSQSTRVTDGRIDRQTERITSYGS